MCYMPDEVLRGLLDAALVCSDCCLRRHGELLWLSYHELSLLWARPCVSILQIMRAVKTCLESNWCILMALLLVGTDDQVALQGRR